MYYSLVCAFLEIKNILTLIRMVLFCIPISVGGRFFLQPMVRLLLIYYLVTVCVSELDFQCRGWDRTHRMTWDGAKFMVIEWRLVWR